MHLWWVRACWFICVRMAWDPLNMFNIALTMSRKSKHSFRIESLLNAVRTYILHCRSFTCNEMLELFLFLVVAFWQFYRIYNRLLTSNSKIITRFNSWLFVVNFYFLPNFEYSNEIEPWTKLIQSHCHKCISILSQSSVSALETHLNSVFICIIWSKSENGKTLWLVQNVFILP